MFPGSLISRLKLLLTGAGEGNDRKRKSVVPLGNIDAKKARITKLSSIPAPMEENSHYRSTAKQNGAQQYASSSAVVTSSSSGVRRLSDLTDMSQLNHFHGSTANSSNFRAVPMSKQVSQSRPMAKRSNNGPPMLIPIKQLSSSSSSRNDVDSEGFLDSISWKATKRPNDVVPKLVPYVGQVNPTESIPELTDDFRNLLRTKYSTTPYRATQQLGNPLSDLDRELNKQREARKRYEALMNKFIPIGNVPPILGAYGQFKRNSLNGEVPSAQKISSVETVILTDDEEDDDENDDSVRIEESASKRTGQLFTTIDPKQLSLMYDDNESENSVQPPAENVNTIREKFETKHVFRENIIQDVQQRYGSLYTSRQSLIEQEKERLDRLKRNTQEQEGLMRNKMLNYVCSFYKFDVLDETELKEATPEPQEVPLPALTQAQLDLIQRKLRSGSNEIVAEKFGLRITRSDLASLTGRNWLNDVVINFYMELLQERSVLKKDQGVPKVYAMNTFFMDRLLEHGYTSVRRWTRKRDLLAHDVIVAPVHVGKIHWCMSIIDLRKKTIDYYDSMGGQHNAALKALEDYLCEESLDKRKTPFDISGFTKTNIRDCPRQENGSDCGVFSCMFAEFLTRDHPITFNQSNMDYFRQKMMVEIVQNQLLT